MALRLGVVGVGDVAQRDYLPELERLGDRASLAVVAARTEERAREAAARFGAERWTTSYETVTAADDVDAIVNLTPFSLHVEVTLAALEAGKHVYSEKPLAPSLAEARQIRDAAAARGLRVVAAPSVLLFPQVRRALEIVSGGELGPIASARGQGLGGIPPWQGYLSDPTPFFSSGGGPLADMAVYPLHALTGLLGPARSVVAFARRTRESFTVADGRFAGLEVPVEVDDLWQLLVRFESGCLATVEASNTADYTLAPEIELLGERGTLGLSLLDVSQPLQLLDAAGPRSEQVAHGRAAGPDHILGVQHLLDCIEKGAQPVANVEHALHVIEILEAARRSATEAVAVEVTSSFPRPTFPAEVAAHGR